MAKPLRPKRGTTAKNDAFTGLAYEITIDTEKHSIRVHDGVTAGGHEILPKAKNDEIYAPKDLDVGVTSVNGNTGDVTPEQTGCLPLSGGNVTGNLTVQGKNVVRSLNGITADASGNVAISTSPTISSPSYILAEKTFSQFTGTQTYTYTMPQNGLVEVEAKLVSNAASNKCTSIIYVDNVQIRKATTNVSKNSALTLAPILFLNKGSVIKVEYTSTLTAKETTCFNLKIAAFDFA